DSGVLVVRFPLGDRRTNHCPNARKGMLYVGDSRTSNLDAGVTPRLDILSRVADPVHSHTQTGDESDLSVNRQHLSMLPRDPAQRTVQTRRVETTHVDTARA